MFASRESLPFCNCLHVSLCSCTQSTSTESACSHARQVGLIVAEVQSLKCGNDDAAAAADDATPVAAVAADEAGKSGVTAGKVLVISACVLAHPATFHEIRWKGGILLPSRL